MVAVDEKHAGMVAQVADEILKAKRVLIITGAGLSADSGLPTYRGIGGLYDRAETEEGFAIEDALSGPMLSSRPEICWKYIFELECSCRGAELNDGHVAIKELEEFVEELWVLTQNVDGFHSDAQSKNLIEIHGNLRVLHCTKCEYREDVNDYSDLTIPPKCPRCESLVRPEVVLFGEMLPPAAISRLQTQLEQGFDLVISVGTSSMFPYIAQPVLMARVSGRPTVEINPGETSLSPAVRYRLPTRAAATLRSIADGCKTRSKNA